MSSTLVGSSSLAEIQFPVQKQTERFEARLQSIESYIKSSEQYPTIEGKIDYFSYSGIRNELTSLQNLVRLYSTGNKYKALKPFYKQVKEFEDLISHLGDLRMFVGQAQGPAAKEYAELLKKKEEAYKAMLEQSNWLNTEASKTQQIRSALATVEWPDLNADRDFLLRKIAKRMQSQQKKKLDMSKVEEGMHELKRDARRLTYMTAPLGYNFIQGDYNRVCPLGKPVVEEELAPVTQYTCKVSECLISKLREVEWAASSMKHEGQAYLLRGEPVSPELLARAKKTHDDLIASETYLHIAAQIRGCRSPEDLKKNDDDRDEDAVGTNPGAPK